MSSLNLFDAGKNRVSVGFRGGLGSVECAQMLPALTTDIDARAPAAVLKPNVLRRSGIQTGQSFEQKGQRAKRTPFSQMRRSDFLAMPFRLRTAFIGRAGCGDCCCRNDTLLGNRHFLPCFGAGLSAPVGQTNLYLGLIRVRPPHSRRPHAASRDVIPTRTQSAVLGDQRSFDDRCFRQGNTFGQADHSEGVRAMSFDRPVEKGLSLVSAVERAPHMVGPSTTQRVAGKPDVGFALGGARNLVDAPDALYRGINHRISLTQSSLARGDGAASTTPSPRILVPDRGADK